MLFNGPDTIVNFSKFASSGKVVFLLVWFPAVYLPFSSFNFPSLVSFVLSITCGAVQICGGMAPASPECVLPRCVGQPSRHGFRVPQAICQGGAVPFAGELGTLLRRHWCVEKILCLSLCEPETWIIEFLSSGVGVVSCFLMSLTHVVAVSCCCCGVGGGT